jgi:DMSO/TMAO reductase YedYZ molybdopterin-dependent catalytic subunit
MTIKYKSSDNRIDSPLPHIDPQTFRLRIEGGVSKVLELSVDALRNDFPQHEVISSLQVSFAPYTPINSIDR